MPHTPFLFLFLCISLNDSNLLSTALIAQCAGDTFFGAGFTILLYGDIGTGKTTFARNFIGSYLEEDQPQVSSPTFTLDTTYIHPTTGLEMHHMDLYRIQNEGELEVLNLPHIFENSMSLVEWPSRLHNTKYFPKSYVAIHMEMNHDIETEKADSCASHQHGCCAHDDSAQNHHHHGEQSDHHCCSHHENRHAEGDPRMIHVSCVNMGLPGRVLMRQLIGRIEDVQDGLDHHGHHHHHGNGESCGHHH